jgi:hypothetical protein
MVFGEIKPSLNEIAHLLRVLVKTQCSAVSPSPAITSGGTGNIPSGYKSVSIVATTVPVTVTFSDGSTYTFTIIGESIEHAASEGGVLPAYTFSGGTIKWTGVK